MAFNATVRAISVGCTYALPLCIKFPPKPNELLCNIQVEHQITTLITVPTLLEQLVTKLITEKNTHIALEPLEKLKFIMYSGAGCPQELSKILVDHGARLLSLYGSTGHL